MAATKPIYNNAGNLDFRVTGAATVDGSGNLQVSVVATKPVYVNGTNLDFRTTGVMSVDGSGNLQVSIAATKPIYNNAGNLDFRIGSTLLVDGSGNLGVDTAQFETIANLEQSRKEIDLDDSLSTPSAVDGQGHVVDPGSDNGIEAKIEQLAVAGMAVRNQTAGTGYNAAGKEIVIPTSTSLAIAASDPTNPRDDIVACNSAGALAVRQGTPNASPVDPTLTAGDVILARVRVAAGVTTIVDANITDLRRREGIDPRKLFVRWRWERFNGNASATKFTLAKRIYSQFFSEAIALVDGAVSDNLGTGALAASVDEFKIILEAGVNKAEFGAAPATGTNNVVVRYAASAVGA